MERADEDDFHAYVSERLERWRRTAYLLCQDWHTADDLVSITVTKLFRNWRKVRKAYNRDAYGWSVPDRIVDRESLARLLKALGPKQRAVLVLRFYLDYSVEETADILRISAGTVKSQSARGLETLRAAAVSLGN